MVAPEGESDDAPMCCSSRDLYRYLHYLSIKNTSISIFGAIHWIERWFWQAPQRGTSLEYPIRTLRPHKAFFHRLQFEATVWHCFFFQMQQSHRGVDRTTTLPYSTLCPTAHNHRGDDRTKTVRYNNYMHRVIGVLIVLQHYLLRPTRTQQVSHAKNVSVVKL